MWIRIECKKTASSPWHDTGVRESNLDTARKVWTDIVRKLRYHAFRLIVES